MKILSVLLIFFMFCGCAPKEEIKTESVAVTPVELSGLKTEKIEWGIKKNEGAPPDVPTNVKEMLKKYNGVYIGDTNVKKIYLTFDEGYENGYTPAILDVLKRNKVPTAFFITGDYIDRCPDIVKRMAKEGHIIGNHSENHPSFAEIPIDEIENEINVLNKKIKELTGTDVKYIRPPKGEYSEQVMGKLYNMGYKTVFWSFAYLDWDVTIQRGGDYAYNQIMPYLDEGMVLLLHAVSGDNADCLEKFIKDARAKGYEFAAIDEL